MTDKLKTQLSAASRHATANR